MNNFEVCFGCRRINARSRRLFTGNQSPLIPLEASEGQESMNAFLFLYWLQISPIANGISSPSITTTYCFSFFISSSAISYQMIHKLCYRLLFETNDIGMMKCGLFSQVFRRTGDFLRIRKRKYFCKKLRTCLFKDICNEIKSFFYWTRVGNKAWLQ